MTFALAPALNAVSAMATAITAPVSRIVATLGEHGLATRYFFARTRAAAITTARVLPSRAQNVTTLLNLEVAIPPATLTVPLASPVAPAKRPVPPTIVSFRSPENGFPYFARDLGVGWLELPGV